LQLYRHGQPRSPQRRDKQCGIEMYLLDLVLHPFPAIYRFKHLRRLCPFNIRKVHAGAILKLYRGCEDSTQERQCTYKANFAGCLARRTGFDRY
jgi:hypothetical protein